MTITTKAVALPIALAGGLLLSACGGGAGQDAMLEGFASECKTSFEAAGGSAEMATSVCDCSVEQIKEQELGLTDLNDQEKMTAIGEACAAEAMASQEGAAE